MDNTDRSRRVREHRARLRKPLICKEESTLTDLEENQCRYHIDNHGFCGKQKQKGSSYCPHHTSIVAPKEAQRKPIKVYTGHRVTTKFTYEE